MKKYIFALLAMLFSINLYSQNTYLSFKFKTNPDALYYKMGDDYIEFESNSDSDSNNFFFANINISEPTFIEVKFLDKIDNYFNLFLIPGDSISIYSYNNKFNFNQDFKSYGMNLFLNDLYNTKILYQYGIYGLLFMNKIGLVNSLEYLEKSLSATLNNYIGEYNINDDYFINTMRKQITIFVNSIKLNFIRTIFSDDDAAKYVEKLDPENEKFLNFQYYRQYVENYVLAHFVLEQEKYFEKYDENDKLSYYTIILEIADKWIKNQKIKNYYCTKLIGVSLKYISAQQGSEELIKLYESICTDEKAKVEIKKDYNEYIKKAIKKGDSMPEFTYEDLKGNKITLDKYKGKFVFLDFWAQWCSPCKEEIPYLKKLVEKYKDKGIVFVSICVWDEKDKWKNYLQKSEMNWEQLYAGSDNKLTTQLNINGIPHFMILDKDGKILIPDCETPSSPEIFGTLDNLLK